MSRQGPRDAGQRLVIGVGNPWRSDDGVGPAVAQHLRRQAPAGVEVMECHGEPATLLSAFEGASEVWIVDAMVSHHRGGEIHRFDAREHPLPSELDDLSSHGLGVAQAVELARALGRLPQRLIVYGIEGTWFRSGQGLSEEVAQAVPRIACLLLGELGQPLARASPAGSPAPPGDGA